MTMIDTGLRGFLVDLLPRAFWRRGNLFWGGRLHFCYGDRSQSDRRTVRVVEWNGRRVGTGSRTRTIEKGTGQAL